MNDARYPNISAIDNRLAELENEKQQLLALREALRSAQNERSVQTFTPEQKVALFRQRFRGREDIFANRWQNQQGRSGYSVACDNEWINGAWPQKLSATPEHFAKVLSHVLPRTQH